MARDVLVITELSIAIVVILTMGIITAIRSKSLTNKYFTAVFFVLTVRSIVGLAIRILSMYLESYPELEFPYTLLIHIVPAIIIAEVIIYSTGFYIINFGEKYYRERKGVIVFFLLVIIIPATIFSFYFFRDYGLGFTFELPPFEDYENFKLQLPLGISMIVLMTIFCGSCMYLVIRILPETTNRSQKWKIIGLMLVVFIVFISTVNLMLVDMQFFPANWIGIGSILNLAAIVLLFISIVRKT